MSRISFWLLVWCALPVCELRPAGPGPPPPVILISVDTLRADRLSCYGNRGLATPNIDALAQAGTLFSQGSAQAPLTLPSHVSLLTSTLPLSNSINDNGQQLAPNAVTLASVLKARGYRTAAFVGGFVLDRRFGLGQGFDLYDSPFDLHRKRGIDPGDVKRPGEDVVRAARQWLGSNAGVPFFVFLHLYDLHTPYDLPRALRARFPAAGYDAELLYVDGILGGFWKFLGQRGLLDKALIVFTSDHGEGLGDHGESTHGYFIYQSTLRVPLIIRWPAGAAEFKRRVDEPAGLLNVAPTILQFAGVPAPREMQGQSLLGPARPKPSGFKEEIYSESFYAREHFGCAVLRSLRLGQYKYIDSPKPEIYDLSQDPDEAQNLYDRQKSLASSLRQRLMALRLRFQANHAARSEAPSLQVVAALRSLGYLAGGASSPGPRESGADPKDRIEAFESYGRALLLASSGRLAEANRRLQQLLEKLPDVPDLRISLGLNLQRLGRHEPAVETFRQVLRKAPMNVLAHFNLGVSQFQLNQLDNAIKELHATLAMAPYYARAEELLGTIWVQKKDYARARESFLRILTLAPDDYTAHYNLGALATLEGKWEEGERHLLQALSIDPMAPEVHNALGSLYLRRGDLERARTALEQAVRLEPKFAWAHYNLGLVLRRQTKQEEARQEFREALAADPQFRAAQVALDRLQRLGK